MMNRHHLGVSRRVLDAYYNTLSQYLAIKQPEDNLIVFLL